MRIVLFLFFWVIVFTAAGRSVSDTVVVYEKEIVYDTLRVSDTVRVKKRFSPPAVAWGIHSGIFFAAPVATLPANGIILRECINVQNETSMKSMIKTSVKSMTKSCLVCTCLMLLHQVTDVAAQETGTELCSFPAQFGLVYPLGSHGKQSVDYRYNLSLNLLTGRVGAVNGLEFGGLLNRTEKGVKGLQAAAILNMSGGETVGVQTGGIGSIAGNIKGLQDGGIFVLADTVTGVQNGGILAMADSLKGLQAGGILNVAGNLKGLQMAGVLNLSESVLGFQAAGVVNVTENLKGAQMAGVLNVSDTVKGFTMALVNKTNVLRGVSFGLVAITDTIEKGGTVALINVVKRGRYSAWELSFADYANVAVSYKLGGKGCYTIYTVGANFLEDRMWMAGLGLGHRSMISNRIDFTPELVAYAYFPEDFSVQGCYTFSTHLKLGFMYKLSSRMGLSVAPSIYSLSADRTDRKEYKVSSFSSWHTSRSGTSKTQIGMGVSVGVHLW